MRRPIYPTPVVALYAATHHPNHSRYCLIFHAVPQCSYCIYYNHGARRREESREAEMHDHNTPNPNPHSDLELGFGQLVKRRRKQLDLTQQALAEELGYSADTVKKIEAGKLKPSRQLAELLAQALEIAPQERPAFIHSARMPGLGQSGAVPDGGASGTAPPQIAPSPSPSPRAQDSGPNNLPVQLTVLIGREKEIEAVCSMLGREEVHLVTLTGVGGTGKTRLALQVAAKMLEDFRDGVWFVDLAPLNDAGLVVPTIAQTLGVKEVGGEALIDTVEGYLTGKRMLLVLDNLEQVVQAAPGLGDLLVASYSLKILATSRAPLGIRGEKEYPVPPLSLPSAERLSEVTPERAMEYEAVRLFAERARDIKPDFELTNENAPAVGEICVRLDGLPLAIELAAARSRLLTPHDMLSRLSSRLKFLTGGAKDSAARQRTLRSTIDWSYNLLSEAEKQLFRRLAVFQGGRSLEAIEAVCGGDPSAEGEGVGDLPELQVDVLEGVESLIAKSLLRQEEGLGGESRFVTLETVQEYAREKLQESGEEEEIRRRHARYFLALAEEAELFLHGPREAEWLDRLEEEHDNLRGALAWLASSAEAEPDAGLRLAGALGGFWFARSMLSEGREWLETMLAARASSRASVSASPNLRAKALEHLAGLALEQCDYGKARISIEESLRLWRDIQDKRGIAGCLHLLGWVASAGERDLEKAMKVYQESLALRQELGDKRGVSVTLNNMCVAAFSLGDYETSKMLGEESLALAREVGNTRAIPYTLQALAQVELAVGHYSQATMLLRESIELSQQVKDRPSITDHLFAMACVAAAQGKAEQAAHMYGAAEALREGVGSPLPADEREYYDRYLTAARARLGEEAWQKAFREGRAMSVEQAIEYAVDRAPEG